MDKRLISVLMIVLGVFAVGLLVDNVGAAGEKQQEKIAVVSVPRIMMESEYASQVQSSVDKLKEASLAELETLKEDMDSINADMKTRRQGSEEFLKLKRSLMEKRAVAEAQKDFLQDELMEKNKVAMEQLYGKILECVKEVSEAKGLELVLDCDEVNLPAAGVNDLTMMIQTHKVLHYSPDLDITDEVITLIDSE